jgi:hypothetical protein
MARTSAGAAQRNPTSPGCGRLVDVIFLNDFEQGEIGPVPAREGNAAG